MRIPRRFLKRHECVPDDMLKGMFHAIERNPCIDPQDFFGVERVEEVAGCPCCFSRVVGVYDLVVRCLTGEEMLCQLAAQTWPCDESDGLTTAERLAHLSRL